MFTSAVFSREFNVIKKIKKQILLLCIVFILPGCSSEVNEVNAKGQFVLLTITRSEWWDGDDDCSEEGLSSPITTTHEVKVGDTKAFNSGYMTILEIREDVVAVQFRGEDITEIIEWSRTRTPYEWTVELASGEAYRIGTDWAGEGIDWVLIFNQIEDREYEFSEEESIEMFVIYERDWKENKVQN